MQTLQSGSFLNLENSESIEALKFTARRLAEHTTNAVKENLTAVSLENLANSLWQKAEYVARETERRRLQQIFVENFSERFRELKPDVVVSMIEVADSLNQSLVPEQVVDDKMIADNHAPSAEQTSEIAEEKDEFLGFVKSDESFGDATEREDKAITVGREADQSEGKTTSETAKRENPIVVAETSVLEDEQIEKPNSEIEKAETANLPPTAATAKNDSPAANQVNQVSAQAKEPFEFGKCAVSLNLTLLAGSGAGKNRRAIISAASHNLPPEIEFLEIADGEDLEQITELVKNKLARFRQSLPVKYIEQLRTAKSKTAKKSEPTKSTVATAPTQTEKKQPEWAEEKIQTATVTAPLPQVNQQSAANEIQGSLF